MDNVADLRAATPTDAAKRVVPDVVAERQMLDDARSRLSSALRSWVRRERHGLSQVRSRPAMANPLTQVTLRREELDRATAAIRRDITRLLKQETAEVKALRAQVSALGPAATLARGYAVVQVQPRDGSEPEVVTSIAQAPPGSQLRIRVGDGSITAASMAATPAE